MIIRHFFRISFIIGITVPFFLIIGCDDTARPSSTIVFPEKEVSYSMHVQPLFNQTCALSGCHDDFTRAGGLSLTNYVDATEDMRIVDPGNPNNSALYNRLIGFGGDLMPLGRPPLTRNQINGIYLWIEEGAQDN